MYKSFGTVAWCMSKSSLFIFCVREIRVGVGQVLFAAYVYQLRGLLMSAMRAICCCGCCGIIGMGWACIFCMFH